MPGTDDIAEKVADILLEQSAKVGAMAANVVPRAVQSLSSIGQVKLGQLIQEVRKNQNLKKLLGIEGEISTPQMAEILNKTAQKSSTLMVSDSDAKDFEALLNEQGVLYAKIDRDDDDCQMFVFLNRDRDKVINASTILQANRGVVTELSPDLYFNSLAPDKVQVIQGLSPEELELFRHYAREQGVLFTAVARKDDTMIVCNAKDAQKARRALLYTGWALTGANGARVLEQVQYRLQGRNAIRMSVDEAERELYIVSGINPENYVKISVQDLVQYKRGKEISRVSRSDPDFYSKCIALSESLVHPVVLSANQWQPGLSAQDLEGSRTLDLFPEVYDDIIQIEQVNRLVNLVARKSGLDDEHNATWGLWDPSVSYSEFAGYEYIADEDERNARIYEFEHFKQAAYYSQNRHEIQEVDMEEKDLDYLIAKAEQKRRTMAGEDFSRQQSHAQSYTAPFDHGSDREEGRG